MAGIVMSLRTPTADQEQRAHDRHAADPSTSRLTHLTEILQEDMAAARKLDNRIRATAANFAESYVKLRAFLDEVEQGQVWSTLGFASMGAYVADVFKDTPLKGLTVEDRQRVVGELSERGFSTRAIAPVVGVTHKTVVKDRQAGGTSGTTSETVTGNDGRTYPAHRQRDVDDDARPCVSCSALTVRVDSVSTTEPMCVSCGGVTPPRAGATEWSQRLQEVSYNVPMSELADEEVAELEDAAGSLLAKGREKKSPPVKATARDVVDDLDDEPCDCGGCDGYGVPDFVADILDAHRNKRKYNSAYGLAVTILDMDSTVHVLTHLRRPSDGTETPELWDALVEGADRLAQVTRTRRDAECGYETEVSY